MIAEETAETPGAVEQHAEPMTVAVALEATPAASESNAAASEITASQRRAAVAVEAVPEPVTEAPLAMPQPETRAPEIETPVAAAPTPVEELPAEQPQVETSVVAEIETPVAAAPTPVEELPAEQPQVETPVVAEIAAPVPVAPEPTGTQAVIDAPQDPLLTLAEQIRSAQVLHAAAQFAIFEPELAPVVPEAAATPIQEVAPLAAAAPAVEAAPVGQEQKAELPEWEPEPAHSETVATPELPLAAPASQLSGLARLVSAVGTVELVSSAGVVERASASGIADADITRSPELASREAAPVESRLPEAAAREDGARPDPGAQIVETDLATAAEQLALSLSLCSQEVMSQEMASQALTSREAKAESVDYQELNAAVALLEPPAVEPAAHLLLPPPVPQAMIPPPAALVEAPPPMPEAAGLAAPAVSPLADSPPSGSRLALAPLQSYKSAASRSMHPAAPSSKILAQESTPKITLPGPALPPELVSLQSAGVVTNLGNGTTSRTQRAIPGWLVSFLVMLGLVLLGTALFNSLPDQHSKADAKSLPVDTPAPVVQSASHPLAHYIEVTGFRIVVDLSKKSEIHYLVVNHSSAALSDLTVYVTLRSAGAKPGQPPVSRFSFRSPDLAPFESKEMTSPIEKVTRSVAVPDWAELRADVQVTQ